jgi:hypothetical protein
MARGKEKPKKSSVERSIEVIMDKLKRGTYRNAAYEETDRRMLEHYLNGGGLHDSPSWY